MLQRVQSIYLLIVVVLGFTFCMFSPFEFYVLGASEPSWFMLFPLTDWQVLPLMIISLSLPVLALVSLFRFKKRVAQIRLNIFNMVLCVGYYAVWGVYRHFLLKPFSEGGIVALQVVSCVPTIWAATPLVCAVLLLMATRHIVKDEALVRASDRLR